MFTSSKKAFTMIELIFVIVIIGILSAVAIPKLSATREDAADSRDCKNISICVTDVSAHYTATQEADKDYSPACAKAEKSTYNDITITVNDDNITVEGTPKRCEDLNTTFVFGGSRVVL
jgi:prepilin-type N-terminal cleavage/methylation domain-containing protein